jgi:predicted adenylyl cyclase CyaB
MPSNIEIKARAQNVDRLISRVVEISDTPEATELLQEDTFFNVPNGRLKLREFKDGLTPSMLVFYQRPDTTGPKLSEYYHIAITQPSELKAALTLAMGIKGIVRKRRLLYMVGQTRVHVDEVEGLGNFVELEVVLDDGQSAVDGQKIADDLMRKLDINTTDLLSGAYMDMLLAGGEQDSRLGTVYP